MAAEEVSSKKEALARGCCRILNHVVMKKQSNSHSAIVFIGGDVQTIQREMTDSNPYKKWNLESVVQQIADGHQQSTVLAIQPDRMENGSFSCFDSFVQSDELGNPNYDWTGSGKAALYLKHLFERIDETEATSLEHAPKKIVAFSKGTVVLNQILLDWKRCQSAKKFCDTFETLCWMDAGHNAKDQPVWINDSDILKWLAAETKCKVDIRLSPYQIRDQRRPWIGKQEEIFSSILLENMPEYRIKRRFFFQNETPSLLNHFCLLDTLKEYALL